MFTVDVRLSHGSSAIKSTHETRCKSTDHGKQPKIDDSKLPYQPNLLYNLFGSGKSNDGLLVLLKEPIKGRTIAEWFASPKQIKRVSQTLKTYARVYSIDKVIQPNERYYHPDKSDTMIHSSRLKSYVEALAAGESTTMMIASPSVKRANKTIFKLSPSGLLLRLYDSIVDLITVMRKGGKFGKRDIILKAKGFTLIGDLKADVFSTNPLEETVGKQRSLRLECRDDMIEFCKVCRHSLSAIKSSLGNQELDEEAIQCIQLRLEIMEGQDIVQHSAINLVKLIVGSSTEHSRNALKLREVLETILNQRASNIPTSTLEKEDGIAFKTINRLMRDSSRLNLLFLLQTSNEFEGCKNSLGFFRNVLETLPSCKLRLTVADRCESNDESQVENCDASEYETCPLPVKYPRVVERAMTDTESGLFSQHNTSVRRAERLITEPASPKEQRRSELRRMKVNSRALSTFDQNGKSGQVKENLHEAISEAPTGTRVVELNAESLDRLNAQISNVCKNYGILSHPEDRSHHKAHSEATFGFEKEKDRLAQKVSDYEQEVAKTFRLTSEVEMLKKELMRGEDRRINEQDEHRRSLLDLKKHTEILISGLQAQIDDKERSKVRAERELQDKVLTIEKLQQDLVLANERSKMAEERQKMFEGIKADMNKQTQSQATELQVSRAERESAERRYSEKLSSIESEYKQKLEKAVTKVNILETQLTSAQAKLRLQCEEYEAMKSAFGDQEGQAKQAINQQASIQTENSRLRSEMLALNGELERCKDSLAVRECEYREIKSENSHLRHSKSEWDEQKRKGAEREAELRRELERSYEESKDLKLKQKEIKKEIEQRDKVKDDEQRKTEFSEKRKEREHQRLHEEIARLQSMLKSNQDALLKERDTVSQLRLHSDNLSVDNKRLLERNKTLTNEVDLAKQRHSELEEFVQERVSSANVGLRLMSQQSTAKKSPSRIEVVGGLARIVEEYKSVPSPIVRQSKSPRHR